MSRKRSPKQKLLGWGILVAAGVLIVAVFLVTRLVTTPGTPAAVATVAAESSSASVSASSSASVEASTAPTSAASSSAEPAAEPASSSPSASAPPAAAAPSGEVAFVDAAAMDQQSRKDMLLRLIGQGVFTGIEAVGSPPKVGVTELFKGLDPAMQSEFVALVYAYVYNGAAGKEALQIIDAQTGTSTGTYTADGGLKLL